jgi:acetyl esterase/lipase
MKKAVDVICEDPMVVLTADIVYGMRQEFGGLARRPLKLSLVHPKAFTPAEADLRHPVILWICGGAWTEMDRNVWLPELVWFVKRGYVVASVDYSVTYHTRFPEQIEDIKQAIRFLRAHAGEYSLDGSKITVMGESAGGYLAALTGVSGEMKKYDVGDYLDESSAVQAAVCWYPVTQPAALPVPADIVAPPDMARYDDVTQLVGPRTPPFLILHGDADVIVPVKQSESLYEALEKAGVPAFFYRVAGANHADRHFSQKAIKKIIFDFIDTYCPAAPV